MKTTLASAAKEFSEWSQEEFVRRVRPFSDQFNPGHPGYGLPEDFNWTFREGFPLTRLAGKTAEWRTWSAEERAAWIEDYAPHPKEHFEVYWLPHPWHDPVILVEGTDWLFYTWDGNHRIGVAFSARLRIVPAIVGFRMFPRSKFGHPPQSGDSRAHPSSDQALSRVPPFEFRS